ncbi:2',3'-cyclic-nucleotide 3'-phosphodiesterase [Mycena crocata]|nr:2',3'-cyclic-nucleotide 3'-phosphodiesterase [Mycena crocata]
MGVTLWIVPSATDCARLRKIMDARPSKSQPNSEASYPHFYPHITLASLPDTVSSHDAIVAAISAGQQAPSISFSSVQVGDHYFRSVFLAVHPSAALLELHRHVHATLEITPRTPKYPHLSLCYIADEDFVERSAYFQELQQSGKIRGNEETNGVSINCGASGEDDWLSEFEAAEIWITRCEGPVETWIVEKKIALQ